ncbi:hypothetical protein MNBD_GAMMA01-2310 [hydrothermal vent metagenome]|uniref:Transposase DDE domain-containing protein n=1 Tax=hydrothermal vent metagenome TaxID=652676 RepID=A0A3B0VK90_9ZZZZ
MINKACETSSFTGFLGQYLISLDRESIRSEGSLVLNKISHYLRRIAGYLTKIRSNFGKIQLFRSRILFLGQALITLIPI